MLDAQKPFGRDGVSTWSDGSVALGRRLAKFLPEDDFDAQPIVLPGGMRLVADVRLDNRDELHRKLGLAPDDAASLSDSAVLGLAFGRWREDCFRHLLGEYAFAVWDPAGQSWLLARDPLGRRPLFFFNDQNLFAAATMPAGLHALPEIGCEVNDELLFRLVELLPRGYYQEPRECSVFRNILKLGAGTCLRLSRDREERWPHWTPLRNRLRLKSPGAYREAVRHELDQAVGRALRGTGDVGSQLSGGLDSTAVTATAARLQGTRGRRVTAFTAVPTESPAFEVPRRFADEWDYAKTVAARHTNIEHLRITARDRSPLDHLRHSFALFAMPLANICNVPWIDASLDAARARGLRVILVGNSGNLTLSYTGLPGLPELFGSGRWIALARACAELHQQAGMSWRGLAFQSLGPSLPEPVRNGLQRFSRSGGAATQDDASLLHPDHRARRRSLPLAPEVDPIRQGSLQLRMNVLWLTDSATINKGIAAHWGLQVRDPLGDQRLLEFCLSVPAEEYLRGGRPSALAREGLADRLPEQIRYESRRGLQGTDWHLGLTNDLPALHAQIDSLAASPAASALLDIGRMRELVRNWPKQGWSSAQAEYPYRVGLLRAISAGNFVRGAESCRQGADVFP